jgi:hypothetical protein
MLGVNVVLSSLLESQFPDEYCRRKEERVQRLIESNNACCIVLPVIIVPFEAHARFLPDSIFELTADDASREKIKGAIEFSRVSGSNKVCVMAAESDQIRSLGIVGLVENYSERRIRLQTQLRCEFLQPYELNPSGTHYIVKVRLVSDDEIPDNSHTVDTLIEAKIELNRKLFFLGEAGTSQLLSRLSTVHPGLVGSVEREFLICSDTSELRRILVNYRSLEKLSFFLVAVLHLDQQTLHVVVDTRNTNRRLEILLGKMRASASPLSVSEVSSGPAVNLLRLNNIASAAFFLLALLFILFIKGTGYLELSNQYNHR